MLNKVSLILVFRAVVEIRLHRSLIFESSLFIRNIFDDKNIIVSKINSFPYQMNEILQF